MAVTIKILDILKNAGEMELFGNSLLNIINQSKPSILYSLFLVTDSSA